MYAFGFHLQVTGVLLVVSAAVTRASSYMHAHGSKEMWPYFRLKCDLKCPHGYQTDVEGNYVCFCYDPCQNVRCFNGTECVVDESKTCTSTGDSCRPRATCRVISQSSGSPHSPSQLQQQSRLQADDAATTSAETAVPEICLLPVVEEAKRCRKIRTRWFFDDVTGTCRPFHGCRATGNNFKRQKGCERKCLKSRKKQRRPKSRLVTQADDASVTSQEKQQRVQPPPKCLLPPVPSTAGCKGARKRWFFDAATGSCKKFRSCSTPGNNFSKKWHCKTRCLGRKKSSRRKGRRSTRQPAVQ